jgi:CDP-paratose 2-epimerase
MEINKILITGGCGFVGSNISIYLKKNLIKSKIYSLDNLSQKGSNFIYKRLIKYGIKNYQYDVSSYNQIKKLPKFDLIIDCCAEPAVETSRLEIDRVINTNFVGTFNIIKKAKKDKAKIIFLSSSRVYSIKEINRIVKYKKKLKNKLLISKLIGLKFDVLKPKSIYGLTKLASEMLIEEFSYAFNLKYIINRCGVISGPWQFGKQNQGFVSLWIWKHIIRKKLNYIGYGGYGNQVRDVLHINDLCDLIKIQVNKFKKINNKTFCVGGGNISNTSLIQLTKICQKITGNKISIKKIKKTSIYDVPYFITDNKLVKEYYGWRPKKKIIDIVNDTYNWLIKYQKHISKII